MKPKKEESMMEKVRKEAFDTIQRLKIGDIGVKEAGEIRNLLDTVIDTGKTEVEMLKALPESVKLDMYENSQSSSKNQRSLPADMDDESESKENPNQEYFVPIFRS